MSNDSKIPWKDENAREGQDFQKRLEDSLSTLFTNSQSMKHDSTKSFDMESFGVDFDNVDVNTDDAPYLDEEIYLRTEELLDRDGSLPQKVLMNNDSVNDGDDRFSRGGMPNPISTYQNKELSTIASSLMNMNPSIPTDFQEPSFDTTYAANSESYANDQAILQALAAKQERLNNLAAKDSFKTNSTMQNSLSPEQRVQSEELHRQVFANEEGYLQQTRLFRESLSADGDSAKSRADETNKRREKQRQAAILRRSAQYRKDQQEKWSLLEREMNEFLESNNILSREEALTAQRKQKEGKSDVLRCSKCAAVLTSDEISHAHSPYGETNSNNNRNPKLQRQKETKYICRHCQVDMMQKKNGSPYSKNGSPYSKSVNNVSSVIGSGYGDYKLNFKNPQSQQSRAQKKNEAKYLDRNGVRQMGSQSSNRERPKKVYEADEVALKELTVEELKQILRHYGLKVSGKKKDLIERITRNTRD